MNKEVIMKRAVKWLRRSAFGLGIAAALAFGGYQAFGSTARAPCDEVPPDFGTCVDQEECQNKCNAYYGIGGAEGFCVFNCCICIEL
jgi:hypothetical protein